jgi:transcriptional regulator with XRE-family HTH domain
LIGERLLDLRKDAGLTQDELAAILKINKHSISSYEREKSEPPDIIKIEIANYFHVSIDYLLGVTDNPNAYDHEHNILLLPNALPQSAKKSLYDYVDFLEYKYLNSKRENKK